ncbi:MAG: hypothetical protein HY663_06650 [Chloroflexi bacterium]|nr:hypothetical protein [Chloroflexota bacterium]
MMVIESQEGVFVPLSAGVTCRHIDIPEDVSNQAKRSPANRLGLWTAPVSKALR